MSLQNILSILRLNIMLANIEKDDSSAIFDQMEILHETKCLYENFYKESDYCRGDYTWKIKENLALKKP